MKIWNNYIILKTKENQILVQNELDSEIRLKELTEVADIKMKLLEVLDYMFSVQQDFSLTKILQIYPETSLIELCRKYESYTTSKIPNNFRKILKSEYELLTLYINLLTNCDNIYMESQIIEFFFKHFFKRKALIDNLRNTVLLDTNQRKESFEEMRQLYNKIGFYLGSPYQWMEDEELLLDKRKTLEKLLEIIELDTEMIQLFNYLNLYKPIFEFLIKEKNLISKWLNKENKNNFEENIVEISKLWFEILTVFSKNATLLPGYLLSRIKFLFNIYKSEVGDVGNLNLFITVLRMIQKQQGNFAVEMFLRQLWDPISFINPSSITKVLKVFWEFIKEGYFNPLIFDLFVTTFTPYLERWMQNLPGVVTYNGKEPTPEDSVLTIENIHMIYLITSVFWDSKDSSKHSDFLNFEMPLSYKPRTRLFSKYLISKIGEIFTLENINIWYTKLWVVLSKLKELIKEATDHSGWNTGKIMHPIEENNIDVKIKAIIYNFIKIYKIVEGNSHDMSYYWNSFIHNKPDEKEIDSENDSLEIDLNNTKVSFQMLYKLKRNMISKIMPRPNMKYEPNDVDGSQISIDEEFDRFNNDINNQLGHLNLRRASSFNQDDLLEEPTPKVKKYMTFRNKRMARSRKLKQNRVFNFSILKAKNSFIKNINETIEKDEDVENIERYEREEYDELITNSFKYLEKDKDFRDSVIFERKSSFSRTMKSYKLVPNNDTFTKSKLKREHKALRKLKVVIK